MLKTNLDSNLKQLLFNEIGPQSSLSCCVRWWLDSGCGQRSEISNGINWWNPFMNFSSLNKMYGYIPTSCTIPYYCEMCKIWYCTLNFTLILNFNCSSPVIFYIISFHSQFQTSRRKKRKWKPPLQIQKLQGRLDHVWWSHQALSRQRFILRQ